MSTTDPRPSPDTDVDVDVVTLVDADITRAVQETLARTASPYFGSADLAVNLNGLRRHVGELAAQRPDLLDTLAAHYDVPATAFHVLNAVESDAHDHLHHRYEAAGAYSAPSILNTAHLEREHPDPGRLAASTREEQRTPPPGTPDPARGMTR